MVLKCGDRGLYQRLIYMYHDIYFSFAYDELKVAVDEKYIISEEKR